jgi:hypothetical protein
MTVEELIEELKLLPPTAMVDVIENFDDAIPRDIIETNYNYGRASILITAIPLIARDDDD